MRDVYTVYLVVHELFGISATGQYMQLVTPDVSHCHDMGHKMRGHTYKIGRFKNRIWQPDAVMNQNGTYELHGVSSGKGAGVGTIPHQEYNAHPSRKFGLSKIAPFCTFVAPLPAKLHQLRLLSIHKRPLFTGRDGDEVEKQIHAISLVQVFEYVTDTKGFKITETLSGQQRDVQLDYDPDDVNQTINVHLWASIEDESGMDDSMAAAHSKCATEALIKLFAPVPDLHGTQSLSVNDWYHKQLRMPDGLAFVELMTLAERFEQRHARPDFSPDCSAKTCGLGSNLYIDAA